MTEIELTEKDRQAYRDFSFKAQNARIRANAILIEMMKLLKERSKEEPLPLQIETARVLAELAKAICW